MVEPAGLPDAPPGADIRGDGLNDELSEVSVADPRRIRQCLLQDPCQVRLDDLQADLLSHFSAQAVEHGLALLEESAGSHPRVAPPLFWRMPYEENPPAAVMDQTAGRPEGVLLDVHRGMARRELDSSLLDRHASEAFERVGEAVLADAGSHPRVHMGRLFNIPLGSPPAHGGARMPDDVSDRATKVYDAMKSAGIIAEDKMRDADAITKMSKLSKNFVLQALQELQSKGYVKRKAREKAAGYFIVK